MRGSIEFRYDDAPASYSHTVAGSLWVSRLIISDATKVKLSAVHGLDWHEVSEAIVGVAGLDYFWHDDPKRGLRAIVEADIGSRACVIVLYPVADPSATPTRREAPAPGDTFI